MRYLIVLSVLFFVEPVAADSMPIRGATGDGYGQFSWGTSLATVEKMSPRLSVFEEETRTRFERTARKQLLKADRSAKRASGRTQLKRTPKGDRRFKSYRHWVKMAGLDGRVTLSFYRDQLFEVAVGLLYSAKMRSSSKDVVEALIAKYGPVLPDAEGLTPKSDAPVVSLDIGGGRLTIYRARPKAGKTGYLKLLYESDSFGTEAARYLTDLKVRISHLKTTRSRAANQRGGAAKKRRQKKLMERL